MSEVNRLYVEQRSPVQNLLDKAQLGLGVGALAGAGYLFLEEKPNDLAKAQRMEQQYLQGTCPEVKCGTGATDSIMRKEYYGMDMGGSILLAAVSTFAIAHRLTRPQRWLRAQTSKP